MDQSTRSVLPAIALGLAAVALPGSAPAGAAPGPVAPPPVSRTFDFTYAVKIPPRAAAEAPLRLFIPLPAENAWQSVSDLRLASPVPHDVGTEEEYGNRYARFDATTAQAAAGFDVVLTFRCTRKEHRVDPSASAGSAAQEPAEPPGMDRWLQADRLVPIDGRIAALAREVTSGATTPLEKARKAYDYVLSTLRYDKTGEGWGRGDALWACDTRRGNCTDFHSLFIGLLRASGIPARFEIGFPLPADARAGTIPGYHCWAEFHLDGRGWIPVDASEAWKHPERRDYYFGAHDADRVQFTTGRDLRLGPEQKGDPLNFFVYPYAESSGAPVTGLETHYAFKDVTAG